MKRLTLLLIVALVATAMPAEAQKIKRANEAISRASELMHNARYEEVDKIIDSLLAINPNYSDALYLRSNALLENDKYEEALDYCSRAIEHHTRKSRYDDSWLFYCRGNINSLMHDFDGAIADFNKALELTPKKDNAHRTRILINRSGCYYYNKDYTNTESDLLDALNYDDGARLGDILASLGDLYLQTGNYQRVIEGSNLLLSAELYPAYAHYQKAYAYLGLEDYEAAIDNAIAMAMYDLSNVGELEFKWMLWHDVEYARKRLHESITEDVNSERVHQHLAIAEALHDYEVMLPLIEVFSKNYDEEQGLIWLTQYSANAGKYDEAALNITTLMEGAEGEDLYFLTAERCGYYRLAGEYDKALADASRLIELIPEEVYGYYTRGWIYELMGDDEAAMANYNQGIEVDDTYAYIYLMRGEQYLKMGNTELAMADFKRVLELDTEVTDGSCRHYALHFLGRDNEAIEWMERIIESDPYKPGYRYDEACLYARMGNVERALDALRLALSLGYKAKAHIENDDELDPIRHTEAYKTLMNEYFN